jgi:recombination protein RecR
VLGGLLSPLDGVGPRELTCDRLVERAKAGPGEVVLALSATVEAEATASYLMDLLKPLPVRITRLARGIPAGGSLEFLDPRTLTQAVAGRVEA